MKKFLIYILIIFSIIFLFACKKEEKKPFGANDISYEKVEGINKNGPTLNESVPENTPPMGHKTMVENGPVHSENDENNKPPIAESDPYGKFEDVPIYQPEHKQ